MRPSPQPPTSLAAILNVARWELAEQLTSLRFLLIALLVLGLIPLSVYVGSRDFQTRLHDHSRLAAEQTELAASGASPSFSPELLRALRAPQPLSVLVRGLDGDLSQYWEFSESGVRLGPTASRPQRLVDLLGQLDLEFLIRVVLALLAILLAFDAVAGEKELGTLRAVLAQPVKRWTVLTGKLLGGGLTLLLALAVAFLSTLFCGQLAGLDLLSGAALATVAAMATTSALYLLCLYALGLLVSSLVTSQKSALILLLVSWVVLVLAMPPLSALVARAVVPVTAPSILEARKEALAREIRVDKERAMGPIYMEITGLPECWFDSGEYEKHKEEIDQRIAPIEIEANRKRRQALGAADREAERLNAAQNRVARLIMTLSPATTYAGLVADLAGTGDDLRRSWLAAVERHQSRLETALFDDPPTLRVRTGPSCSGSTTRRELMTMADLPPFVPPQAGAWHLFSPGVLMPMGLLVLYLALLVAAGFWAFSRYDVR